MKSKKLILIRHGQTHWNYLKKYCSFTDIDLDEKGRDQAKKLLKKLGKEKIYKVYSSDMKRTLQFAKLVFKNTLIERHRELREMNFGIFEGLTYQEIMNRYPEIYKKWLENPIDITIPNGEGLNVLAQRVKRAWSKILSHNNARTVAIVTHAGPIRVILCDILKLDLKDIFKINPDLASISIIAFIKGKGKIHLLNDTSYLNG